MNKPKRQGTDWESWIRDYYRAKGYDTHRLEEGGSKDKGDVAIATNTAGTFTVEAKATQTLNVTRVLNKARVKSGNGKMTVLFWKRLVKLKEGQAKRRADGMPIVVVMGIDTFDMLLDHWNDQ